MYQVVFVARNGDREALLLRNAGWRRMAPLIMGSPEHSRGLADNPGFDDMIVDGTLISDHG